MSGPHYCHRWTEISRTQFSIPSILGIRLRIMEQHATRKILESLHTFSPILLLFIFIGVHVFTTITAASRPKDGTDSRQLPQRTKATGASYKKQRFSPTAKRVFSGLSAILLVTYFGDAAVCVAHVVMTRAEWWCGQSLVVRRHSPHAICDHQG